MSALDVGAGVAGVCGGNQNAGRGLGDWNEGVGEHVRTKFHVGP